MLDKQFDVTQTGAGMSSQHFLAPEQADDTRHADHRADIYSPGITLLFLLAGKRPFGGASSCSIVLAHASKPLPGGAELGTPLPEAIEALSRKMAAKKPEERPADYDTLLADLELVRTGITPARKITAPKILLWLAAALSIATTVIALVYFNHQAKPVQTATPSPAPVQHVERRD